ncbi:MAG: cytoplasmic protein [Deltaproteobacteria bacterium]|nr:cytoplasmic protein [Deltaproteobacteria bacterium]
MKNGTHRHRFVEDYDGMIGFGFDRDTDEKTLMVYLQKFSDDDLLKALVPRLKDEELKEVFQLISRLIKTHLRDEEYHRLFLKDPAD